MGCCRFPAPRVRRHMSRCLLMVGWNSSLIYLASIVKALFDLTYQEHTAFPIFLVRSNLRVIHTHGTFYNTSWESWSHSRQSTLACHSYWWTHSLMSNENAPQLHRFQPNDVSSEFGTGLSLSSWQSKAFQSVWGTDSNWNEWSNTNLLSEVYICARFSLSHWIWFLWAISFD